MIKTSNVYKGLLTAILLVVIGIGAAWLMNLRNHDQQLSVKPERSHSQLKLKPLQSNIGLHATLPFSTLVSAAERATSEAETGTGEKQSCKRILGAKVCATVKWQYSIQRDGEVRIESNGERLQLALPISFNGLVSVDGRGGKIFGLRNKDIDGKLEILADLEVDIAKNWCPVINSDISYRWISDPRIRLAGSIRINLRKSADKALNKKLTDLKSRLTDVVDCEEFRRKIQQQWHTHVLDVDLKDGARSQLLITPDSASVSDIDVAQDHINVSFDLGAIVEMKQPDLDNATEKKTQASVSPLPDLIPHTNTTGAIEFSLLMEIPYSQLRDKLAKRVVGESFGREGAAELTVTSIDLYPADSLLIIDVGFQASTLRSMIKTTGNVYLSAQPVPDPTRDKLILQDLQLTRSIDSKLMTAVTTVLRQQLLTALQEVSVIDLAPSMAKIESSVEKALSNPEKTAGIQIDVLTPDVALMALNPQQDGLAAIIHLSTQVRATVPEDALIR